MRKAISFFFSVAVLAGACTRVPEQPADPVKTPEVKESSVIPGVVIVELDEEQAALYASGIPATKSGPLYGALDNLGVVSVERLYPDAGEWEPRHRKAGLHRWFRVQYNPEAMPATKAADDLTAVPGVVFAEPERRIRKAAYFNDPYAPKQWALYNDGTLKRNFVAGIDVNVEPVWSKFTTGSSNVIVAVIDGGVQLDHPDLAAATIPAGADGSRTFIPGYPDYAVVPTNHGTHVAGAIAAVSNNGIGISGIAGGSDGKGGVRILSCAAMVNDDPDDPDKEHWGSSYNAMVWAADHGAVIANNSWGYNFETEADAKAGGVGSMGTAIDYFIQYAGCDMDGNQRPDSPMKGGVVLFAAGNEHWQAGWPAKYEKVIAVGAVNATGAQASYSNYGDWVDICAPGGDYPTDTDILSTVINNGYDAYSGTSMACPQVSGVAALIVSYFGGPGFTNEMLKERLLLGASESKAPKYGQVGPLVDALGSFSLGGTNPPAPVKDVTASAAANNITLTWKVTSDPDDVKCYAYLALLSKNASDLQDIDRNNLPASVLQQTVLVGTTELGAPISTTFSGLEFETKYYATVIAYDYAANFADPSAVKAVSTGKNNPPVLTTEYTGDYRVKPFEVLDFSVLVKEPDGHAFTVEVTPGSDAFTFKSSDNVVSCQIRGNGAADGKYTAHIVAKDAYGASTDFPIAYEILPNHVPAVVKQADDVIFSQAGQSLTLDLTQYIQDEDGEPLTYSAATSVPNVAHPFVSGTTLTLTTLGYGLTEVSVTATDFCNKSCTLTFLVLVRDPSRPVDLYPNPVEKILNIRPGTEGQLEIAISNKAGATVWSGTQAGSPFAPIAVDMSGMAGGTYYVRIQGAGIDDVYPIAKR